MYALITGYRFRKLLDPLSLPTFQSYQELQTQDFKDKAKASLTTSGVFFAFSIAVLVVIVGGGTYNSAIKSIPLWMLIFTAISVILPYLVIWQERFISAANADKSEKQDEKRGHRYSFLLLWLFLSLIFFVGSGFSMTIQEMFKNVFTLSGVVLIVISAFFLLFALEFYDTASGWRGGSATKAKEMFFHLASLGSHSTSVGVSLALVGVSQLLYLVNFWLGGVTTFVALIILVAMTEIERSLWITANPSTMPDDTDALH